MALIETEVRVSTPQRILDAAFVAIQDFGLSRVTVEDVAQRAGLSRQTVYRYFPSKDDLIVALVSREEERILDGVRAAFTRHDDVATAVRDAVRFVLRSAREHPLLDRLLDADQATFLPYITTRAMPAIVRARETMLQLIVDGAPGADVTRLRPIVDATTRAIVSYMITPTDLSPDDIAETSARLLDAALSRDSK